MYMILYNKLFWHDLCYRMMAVFTKSGFSMRKLVYRVLSAVGFAAAVCGSGVASAATINLLVDWTGAGSKAYEIQGSVTFADSLLGVASTINGGNLSAFTFTAYENGSSLGTFAYTAGGNLNGYLLNLNIDIANLSLVTGQGALILHSGTSGSAFAQYWNEKLSAGANVCPTPGIGSPSTVGFLSNGGFTSICQNGGLLADSRIATSSAISYSAILDLASVSANPSTPSANVPEPSTPLLFGAILIAWFALCRRQRWAK
jgi:hypothetical protein